MKRNKNVVVVEKDVQIARGVFLSEGDALIKTRNGWTLVEAEGDEDEREDEPVEEDEDESDDDEEKVDEKKKK